MDKKIIIREIIKIIRRHLPSEDFKIFLFGSQARGDSHPTSDIDIGILGKQKAPWDIMLRITGEAEAIPTLRKIDIVDFNLVEENFKKSALEDAKIL